MEYEEAHKLSKFYGDFGKGLEIFNFLSFYPLENLIRGLDDDEVQFLELVDQNKMDMEKKQMLEEEQELKDFRSRVATLQEESVDKVNMCKEVELHHLQNKLGKLKVKLCFFN